MRSGFWWRRSRTSRTFPSISQRAVAPGRRRQSWHRRCSAHGPAASGSDCSAAESVASAGAVAGPCLPAALSEPFMPNHLHHQWAKTLNLALPRRAGGRRPQARIMGRATVRVIWRMAAQAQGQAPAGPTRARAAPIPTVHHKGGHANGPSRPPPPPRQAPMAPIPGRRFVVWRSRHRSGYGHSGRAGSVRPLAQNRHGPNHDLKWHPLSWVVYGPELVEPVVLIVQPAADADYRQPPGTRPLRSRCPATSGTGRPLTVGGSLHAITPVPCCLSEPSAFSPARTAAEGRKAE